MPFKSKENEIFLIVSIKNIKNVKVWKEVYKYNCFVRIYYLENKFKCYFILSLYDKIKIIVINPSKNNVFTRT